MSAVWYFTPSPRTLAWITKVHLRLYRATGGIVGSRLLQLDHTARGLRLRWLEVLLLTTRGRRTSAWRTVPLPCFAFEGRTFLVASFAGSDRHPAWYLNLAAHPEVEVQFGARRGRYRAVALSGDERRRIWMRICDEWPRYRAYQATTTREIPIVELIPAWEA